jgi:glycerophosphoryl diester phosphodiesterase
MTHPLLLGHRGARARKDIPENTFASFDHALADRCDGFEFDVRLTADGQAVICHDPSVRDPRDERKEIARSSSRELSHLPRLDDVLERYRNRAFLDIELKVPGLEAITSELLRKYPPQRGFVVSSFVPKVLETLHAADPSLPLGLIADADRPLRLWSKLPIVWIIPHRSLVTPRRLARWKAAGKRILIWTVNSPAEMHRFAASVDGLISDDTARLAATLHC